jgi:hypothetical protein
VFTIQSIAVLALYEMRRKHQVRPVVAAQLRQIPFIANFIYANTSPVCSTEQARWIQDETEYSDSRSFARASNGQRLQSNSKPLSL